MSDILSSFSSYLSSESVREDSLLDSYNLTPRALLWTQLSDRVPPAELAEVRRLIGEPLLELNESLLAELRSLLLLALSLKPAERASLSQGLSRLPDSKAKQFLLAEINLLVSEIRASGEVDDGQLERLARPQTPLQRAILHRAIQPTAAAEPAPALAISRPFTPDVAALPLPRVIDSDSDSVNRIRSLLTTEREALERDIAIVQRFLDSAADHFVSEDAPAQVSEAELRALNSRLREVDQSIARSRVSASAQSNKAPEPAMAIRSEEEIISEMLKQIGPISNHSVSSGASVNFLPAPPVSGTPNKNSLRIRHRKTEIQHKEQTINSGQRVNEAVTPSAKFSLDVSQSAVSRSTPSNSDRSRFIHSLVGKITQQDQKQESTISSMPTPIPLTANRPIVKDRGKRV